jgi:hypothetical protein
MKIFAAVGGQPSVVVFSRGTIMAIAFSRSLRALGNDSFRPSLVAVAVTGALLVAWLAWFLLAPIPIYTSSATFTVQRGNTLAVTFPPETFTRLTIGQKATLRTNISGAPAVTYTGTVLDIDQPGRTRPGAAFVYFDTPEMLPDNLTGEVQVQVETLSPAALVLRAARQSTAALNANPAGLP